MSLDINQELLERLNAVLQNEQLDAHRELWEEGHPADLAELLTKLDEEPADILYAQIPRVKVADVLMELDEDLRARYLEDYSGKEIARDLVENLDSDDAADLINELEDPRRREVLRHISDDQQAQDIARLLVYPEDTAGALMGTELIRVNASWRVLQCVKEMRKQAEEIERVHAIYVVDDDNRLLGTLSLKKLLTTSTKTPISEVFTERHQYVETSTEADEVANIMQKYDLVVVPVIDAVGHLVGRITIDDVVDYIRDEAREDYNLASGLTDEIEDSDSQWQVIRARLPWLLIALAGGLTAAAILGGFEEQLSIIPAMAFFMPLIAAMGGNVGVQSSAIIVQGLARNSLGGSLWRRLWKEVMTAVINGLILGSIIIAASLLLNFAFPLALTVAVALFAVIIVAALVGTFVPLLLDRYNIDPALATGPFITTLNDITGLMIYFYIGRVIIGM